MSDWGDESFDSKERWIQNASHSLFVCVPSANQHFISFRHTSNLTKSQLKWRERGRESGGQSEEEEKLPSASRQDQDGGKGRGKWTQEGREEAEEKGGRRKGRREGRGKGNDGEKQTTKNARTNRSRQPYLGHYGVEELRKTGRSCRKMRAEERGDAVYERKEIDK
ncbi:hypothetical protein B0H13DRAFT_1889732 [Mycena leptocephala]|nr:hypothetical protein B0H13DRAFT_1889732 [Mycena leptocephala]